MRGRFQGENEIIIERSREKIWEILTDGSVLTRWMRIVKHTTSKKECLNAFRSCDVEMNGKMGKVREKCVLFEEPGKIGWEMEYERLVFPKCLIITDFHLNWNP